MSGPKLHIQDVTKRFEAKRGQGVLALDNIDLEVPENQFATIVGPSGCGKSTLLSIVGGLEEPSTGKILVDGRPVIEPGRDRGMVFQSYTLFPWLTVRQNVEFALRPEANLSKKEQRQAAEEHLHLVGLEGFFDSYPHQLSGGMQQRVAIARALCYRPKILLMDEPFGALDAQTRGTMQELLTHVWETHRITVLFVTHDVDEAIFISDRVLVMTARPGRFKDDIRIGLPRPRDFEMMTSVEFVEYKQRIFQEIRQEYAEGPTLVKGEG
jgi:ABC-type nitrate/sulfonate/bicarbonate transport system ATPase subunit